MRDRSHYGLELFHGSLTLELVATGANLLDLWPPGSVYTERKVESRRTLETFQYPDPEVISDAGVRQGAGEGHNGGLYIHTGDGRDLTTYARS